MKCLDVLAGDKPNALAEPRGEEESLTKKGKKKKTVHWAEEEQLKHYFYFDLDETERGRTAAGSSERHRKTKGVRNLDRLLLFLPNPTSQRQQDQGLWRGGQAGADDGPADV